MPPPRRQPEPADESEQTPAGTPPAAGASDAQGASSETSGRSGGSRRSSAADSSASASSSGTPTPASDAGPSGRGGSESVGGGSGSGGGGSESGGGGSESGGGGSGGENVVGSAKQYLIAAPGAVNALAPHMFDPLALQTNARIATVLGSDAARDAGIRLVGKVTGPHSPEVANDPTLPDAQDTIFVAEMNDQHLADFQRNFPTAIITEDAPLDLTPVTPTSGIKIPDPGLLPVMMAEDVVELSLTIRGNGQPVAGANVYLMGSIFPAQGLSDENGKVDFKIYGERPDTLKALYVKPAADFWSLWIQKPTLAQGQNNVVELTPLGAQYPGFPQQQVLGWGQIAMGLDKLPAEMRGQGIKVAVIDSGIQRDHPDLRVTAGRDVIGTVAGQPASDAWGQDSVGHGTHCAGVIGARNDAGGIRGFAPDAEVHAVKIFPGAQISHLLEALNYCIENSIDVANMSLGIAQLAQPQFDLLKGKIDQARAAGVACIVAAGNAAGPVQYPAAIPGVLAVAAMGRQGTFPTTSYHGTQVFEGSGSPAADGTFAAKFTCFGTQIAVSAPGVAILSTFPPRAYTAMDGTSMAAPHVTGLAALILAHHPAFQGEQPRDASRVDRLFQVIRQSCQPLGWGVERRGSGLPDARVILQAATQPTTPEQPGQPAQPTPTRGGVDTDFPMFSHLTPASLAPASLHELEAQLVALEQLERQLTHTGSAQPASVGVPGADDSLLQPGQARSGALGALNAQLLQAGLVRHGSPFGGLFPREEPFFPRGGPTGAARAGAGGQVGALGMMSGTDELDVQFLNSFLRSEVQDLIEKLYAYVRHSGELGDCVPLVTQAVHQFGLGQYAKALASGYQAFACIRGKLSAGAAGRVAAGTGSGGSGGGGG